MEFGCLLVTNGLDSLNTNYKINIKKQNNLTKYTQKRTKNKEKYTTQFG